MLKYNPVPRWRNRQTRRSQKPMELTLHVSSILTRGTAMSWLFLSRSLPLNLVLPYFPYGSTLCHSCQSCFRRLNLVNRHPWSHLAFVCHHFCHRCSQGKITVSHQSRSWLFSFVYNFNRHHYLSCFWNCSHSHHSA